MLTIIKLNIGILLVVLLFILGGCTLSKHYKEYNNTITNDGLEEYRITVSPSKNVFKQGEEVKLLFELEYLGDKEETFLTVAVENISLYNSRIKMNYHRYAIEDYQSRLRTLSNIHNITLKNSEVFRYYIKVDYNNLTHGSYSTGFNLTITDENEYDIIVEDIYFGVRRSYLDF